MLTAVSGLPQIRASYTDDNRDLLRVLLNATSVAEANLALQILTETVPERTLVCACNLREVLSELPASPFAMRVDEATLAHAAGLERGMAAMHKTLDDGIDLAILTAGNLVLDVVVKRDGERHYWNPVPVGDDFIDSAVVDLLIDSDHLLDAVLDLANSMGVVMNPRFYLSLEDWHLETAADAFEGIGELF